MKNIDFVNVNKTFRSKKDEKEIFSNLNLKLPNQGLITIIGLSGIGKTTLLNMISGITRPTSGRIKYNNEDIKNYSPIQKENYFKNVISYINQGNSLINNLTCYQTIKQSLSIQNKELCVDELFNYAKYIEVDHLLNKKVNILSVGERQRVEILQSVLRNSEIILADEPTSSVDFESSERIYNLLNIIARDKLVLVTTHDLYFAQKCSNIMYEVKNKNLTKVLENKSIDIKEINIEKNNIKVDLRDKKIYNLKISFKLVFISVLFSLILSFALSMRKETDEVVSAKITYNNDVNNKTIIRSYMMDDFYRSVSNIKNKYPKLKIEEVYEFNLSREFGSRYFNDNLQSTSYFIPHEEDINLLYGHIPQKNNEILITKLQYMMFEKSGFKMNEMEVVQINEYSDIINKKLFDTKGYVDNDNNLSEYEIVGIIDTNPDLLKINHLSKSDYLTSIHFSLYTVKNFNIYTEDKYVKKSYLIDYEKLSLKEITSLFKDFSIMNISYKNEINNVWNDSFNKEINNNFSNIFIYVILTIVLLATIVIIYFKNNDIIFKSIENKKRLMLGQSKKELLIKALQNNLINSIISFLITITTSFTLIYYLNINLTKKYLIKIDFMKVSFHTETYIFMFTFFFLMVSSLFELYKVLTYEID